MNIRRKKPASPKPDPVLPDGWTLQVRPQETPYGMSWEFLLSAPQHIRKAGFPPAPSGRGYRSRDSAIADAVDLAKDYERSYRNKVQGWEKV